MQIVARICIFSSFFITESRLTRIYRHALFGVLVSAVLKTVTLKCVEDSFSRFTLRKGLSLFLKCFLRLILFVKMKFKQKKFYIYIYVVHAVRHT